jgi:hypothetical protein
MIYNYLKNLISKFFVKFRKKRVNFVYDSDLDSLLKRLEVKDRIDSGYVKCLVCKETITFKNIGAIAKVKGNIEFICEKPVCISNFNK